MLFDYDLDFWSDLRLVVDFTFMIVNLGDRNVVFYTPLLNILDLG